jgi:serine/threonine protein kinase
LAERGWAADLGPSGRSKPTPGDPEHVGPYQILGRLGAGGMGTVFLARRGDGPRVAVKVLRPELARDPSFLRMFRQEVAAARRVVSFCTCATLQVSNLAVPWASGSTWQRRLGWCDGKFVRTARGGPAAPQGRRRPPSRR